MRQPDALPLHCFMCSYRNQAHRALVRRRLCIGGSLIGSIKETQEMLDYCGEKNITCDVEVPTPQSVNTTQHRIEGFATDSQTVLQGAVSRDCPWYGVRQNTAVNH